MGRNKTFLKVELDVASVVVKNVSFTSQNKLCKLCMPASNLTWLDWIF